MKKTSLLLSALAISVGLGLASVPMVSAAALPAAVAGQTLPSLAPMLEKYYPPLSVFMSLGARHSNNACQKSLNSSLARMHHQEKRAAGHSKA